jgi:hypothetical protein
MSNGTRRSRMMKKTGVKKSRWTVPLKKDILGIKKIKIFFLFLKE